MATPPVVSTAKVSFTPPPDTRRSLSAAKKRSGASRHRPSNSRDAGDTYEVFGSGMDATGINKAMFSMPTNSVAKRNAVLDRDNSDFWRCGGMGHRQRTSTSDFSGGHGSPVSDGASCEKSQGPFPLNRTLDHGVTDEELAQRETREAEQLARLMSRVGNHGTQQIVRQRDTEQLLICMVGLPGKGKTYTARRVMRYLSWLGVKCQVFNVAVYRRKNVGYPNADFFDGDNNETSERLMEVFNDALQDTLRYFQSDEGQVAIFDGTNHSLKRRSIIKETMSAVLPADRMLFIEMHEADTPVDVFPAHKITFMPEYVEMDPEDAMRDYIQRVQLYQKAYETIQKSEGVPYVKYSKGHMSMSNVDGYLQKRLLFLLMNLTVMDRNIFLCLTGETGPDPQDCNSPPETGLVDVGQKGLDPLEESRHLRNALQNLDRTTPTKEGGCEKFGKELLKVLQETVPENEPVTVWSSQDQFGVQTVAYLKERGYPTVYWRYLGEFGFSVVQKIMGETYEDMVERLEPIVFEIERCETHLLICGHCGVINALYGYLAEAERGVQVQPRSIVRVQPRAYDLDCQVYVTKGGKLTALPEGLDQTAGRLTT
eukprot:TRINITY_DN2597_c0_g1_i1.p1 TRINITY_DN2597_c0_g1~~TRINITY_DN2597_c0_g1_i1.p1  ORF type:complete len:597 (+),score=201.63 TRINITY_DN2597_c0_g1_i1:157-1947(+)